MKPDIPAVWPDTATEQVMLTDAQRLVDDFPTIGVSDAVECGFHIKALLDRVRQLESALKGRDLLLIRKSEALAIVASPRMWTRYIIGDDRRHAWCGIGTFEDPMAWAKREAEATEACDHA